MSVLIGIALKSLLVAALTLGLLHLLRKRSAAERSWVAHIGLLALVIMAFAPLVLPSWTVATPALFGQSPAAAPAPTPLPAGTMAIAPTVAPAATAPAEALPSLNPEALATAAYALPAAILLLITFIALARLITLRARADVLVDGHWLSALARAQRRMGFKHGTALLTSNELASPISWGLMRPVILLNKRAVEAAGEAEAIIAHELAHVARMDWAKLLLARVATALFWFNPLVWLLAREAHQLREEAADDSVLAADIIDTDYAQLLVGVARHECPGLLLGAHGVAPSKSSLARRVARVLDGKSARGPVARSFALGVFAGALLVAAPLAALTLAPTAPELANAPKRAISASEPSRFVANSVEVPTDLPRIIAKGVSTSVATATAAIAPQIAAVQPDYRVVSRSGASVESTNGTVVSRSPSGATVTVYPPDAQGRRKMVARAPDGSTAVTYADASTYARRHPGRDHAIDAAIEMKAVGVTPDYAAAIRSASPALRNAGTDDIIQLKAVGVTPEYVREVAAAGFGNLNADELTQARAIGLTGDYMRGIRATGVRTSLDDLVQLRAMGVRPDELARLRSSGPVTRERIRDLVRSHARFQPPQPPAPPVPPADNDDGG
jgi:beta-lactamase regulating signal transducer with metallopeptidase domain